MELIRTDQWLLKDSDPLAISNELVPYFKPFPAEAICEHMTRHGLYRNGKNMNAILKKMNDNKVWHIIENEALKLQTKWNGPSLPIFIFPSDDKNEILRDKLDGRSGIAFRDKLLLFISPANEPEELQSLLAHEYHHAVRLSALGETDEHFTLLDSIMMEGLAENAVRELYGEKRTAYWTKLYNEKELKQIWRRFIRPHLHLPKTKQKHHLLLHGHGKYPEMAGYCCGYAAVKSYMKENELKTAELIASPAKEFAASL